MVICSTNLTVSLIKSMSYVYSKLPRTLDSLQHVLGQYNAGRTTDIEFCQELEHPRSGQDWHLYWYVW
jgi:hypothetical protein